MKPEMIFFDYGNTLVYEKVNSGVHNFKEIFDLIESNDELDIESFFYKFIEKKNSYLDDHHPKDIEFKYEDIFKELFEERNINPSKDYEEISKIYFDSYAPGFPMDGAIDLLDYLDSENIRYGVISNLSWSSKVLKARLEETLGKDIDLVLTSGDWVYRKPDSRLFKIAAEKSNTKLEDLWYIGDNPLCDIFGAYRAGMTPVLFKAKTENVFMRDWEKVELDFEYHQIDHLLELKDLIRS